MVDVEGIEVHITTTTWTGTFKGMRGWAAN